MTEESKSLTLDVFDVLEGKETEVTVTLEDLIPPESEYLPKYDDPITIAEDHFWFLERITKNLEGFARTYPRSFLHTKDGRILLRVLRPDRYGIHEAVEFIKSSAIEQVLRLLIDPIETGAKDIGSGMREVIPDKELN